MPFRASLKKRKVNKQLAIPPQARLKPIAASSTKTHVNTCESSQGKQVLQLVKRMDFAPPHERLSVPQSQALHESS